MTISNEEWASIAQHVEREVGRLIGRRRDYFLICKVVKNDTTNNLVWVKELGDQPIPLMAFDYDVAYYDESPRGASVGSYRVYKKHATVKLICPKPGQTVLIAREMGSDFLPRCLGVLHSKKFIIDQEDT
jgi:hypothetical protein